ncbi:hypothetical protein MROS_2247 [Melioribacter roseus P3M-2]|uniref:Uncharacterized protein n=1 Tax=Melioribacter roseus (strain DSM 23840 / JCM 17771 / VKM B-2668 / P3M-2) TaxID=1191523 RepID=I6YY62_MELRP|nr:hypothetical protein [Melioribacter roseus]AFN75477.1 hypothetical protein MROS_2247 [Melioribacter roseus P3M-2]
MELIPILSLIVLVATISTFILAVGAYILYKVRERKGVSEQAAQPAAVPAELVAPPPMAAEAPQYRSTFEQQAGYEPPREQMERPELRPTYVGPAPASYQGDFTREERTPTVERHRKKFMRYTSEGYEEPSVQRKKTEDNLRWR